MTSKTSPSRKKKSALAKSDKRPVSVQRKSQIAALCWRAGKSGREILLITSRDTGRWIIPKGWPISKKAPHQVAEIEAWEEAGVTGKIARKAIGSFKYQKVMQNAVDIPCRVMVYPLKVKAMNPDFPEKDERNLEWVDIEEASRRVNERGLKRLFKSFAKIKKL